jgi:site-specific DNA-cytosine methylase
MSKITMEEVVEVVSRINRTLESKGFDHLSIEGFWDRFINNIPKMQEIAPTLKAQSHGHEPMTIQDAKIRRLTEIECERLQGFPDDWTKYGNYDGTIKEISKTQRYKMCGNAVTVAVVKAVTERLKIN